MLYAGLHVVTSGGEDGVGLGAGVVEETIGGGGGESTQVLAQPSKLMTSLRCWRYERTCLPAEAGERTVRVCLSWTPAVGD